MKSYKVFFHIGEDLGLKTKVSRGTASLSESDLQIHGVKEISVPFASMTSAELFRLHGLGRVIKIDYLGGRLFISVVRFMIGQFATINFFKTGALHERLLEEIQGSPQAPLGKTF